jgi:Uma2 family endonuclease
VKTGLYTVSVATAETSRVYTAEDLLTMPDGDRFEIIDGELKERVMSYLSSYIAARLIVLLSRWIDLGHPGRVAGSDGGFTIFSWAPGDLRMPDVSYISTARLPRIPRTGWVSVPPEFAVEVVSPTDLASDVQKKADDYIRAGVPLVWVVFPRTSSVQVLRGDGTTALVRTGETLTGEAVLPGFEVAIDDLFADLGDETAVPDEQA